MEIRDDQSTDAERAARDGVYETARPDVLRRVPPTARRILDLGCSSGALGVAIKRRQAASVVGVELDPAYAAVARAGLDRVAVCDVGAFVAERPPEAPFDCLICADVLEHLIDPWTALRQAVALLEPGGVAVVSLPNVLHYRAMARLLRHQRWPRDDWGIFDRTHLRWFTLRDAHELLARSGLVVEHVDLRIWYRTPRTERLLSGLKRTPIAPFVAQQHVLVGRKA